MRERCVDAPKFQRSKSVLTPLALTRPAAETGSVKYLSDDLALECEGVAEGKICPAKAKGSFPSPFGV